MSILRCGKHDANIETKHRKLMQANFAAYDALA